MAERIYTVKELSDYLHVSAGTLYNHIYTGLLRASKPAGKYLITARSVDDYLEQMTGPQPVETVERQPLLPLSATPVSGVIEEKRHRPVPPAVPPPIDPNIVIVTRHKGLVEYLRRHGISGVHIEGRARFADVAGKTVYGILPVPLAVVCKEFKYVQIGHHALPLEDLSADQIESAGVRIITYQINELSNTPM